MLWEYRDKKALLLPGSDKVGIKQSKKRLTILLFASTVGKLEPKMVINKAEAPRALIK